MRSVVTLYQAGSREFAADDVPDCDRPANLGLSGNVWHSFVRAHLLAPVYVAPGQIKRRMSAATTRKAAWVNCYSLVSLEAALRWLERHGNVTLRGQMELIPEVMR